MLMVDVVIQAQQAGIDWFGQCVIHEQPYSNAAVSCLDKPERDEVATQVIANKVTLDIDASLGLLDEPEAQTERVDAELQPVDAA
jgi:hypothetical protein